MEVYQEDHDGYNNLSKRAKDYKYSKLKQIIAYPLQGQLSKTFHV